MLPEKIAFVDIETTGSSLFRDRIIEIGVLRIEHNTLIRTYHTLIDPLTHIPEMITELTGITKQDLQQAPPFGQVKDDILDILSDCVFVAHNVRFDYGFLKQEFLRTNHIFAPKHFCTVKLSRTLFPQHRHHNLDSIIERFSLTCDRRHRAFDDAEVLWKFYQRAFVQFGEEKLAEAIALVSKRPSTPLKLPPGTIEHLPESPGVYIMYGSEGMPLYVGKSINIKDRVKSHFVQDIASGTEMKLAQQVESIETITTTGELGALLTESHLIKTLQPLYNKRLRHAHKMIVLRQCMTKAGYKTVRMDAIEDISVDELSTILGVFRSKRQALTYLIERAQTHALCEKLLGVEHSRDECFGYRLGRCKGACKEKESVPVYNVRFDLAMNERRIRPWPYTGPVCIEERDLSGRISQFILDKWCLLGTVTGDQDDISLDSSRSYEFDIDTYKILNSFIRDPKHAKHIRKMTEKGLQEFMATIQHDNQDSFQYI